MNSPLNLFYLLCCFVIMSCATPIVFFSQHTEDISKMRSSIEYSMDKYRLDLASTMKTIEIICNGLDIIDIELPFLESVHSRWKADMSRVPAYYDMNEVFLRRLLSSQDMRPLLAVESGSATPGYSDMPSPSSYDSIAQLLTHVGRDWTQMGRNVREVLYKRGIIQTLNKYISNHSEARVLVPGAGLGRLAAELAVDGYRCVFVMI